MFKNETYQDKNKSNENKTDITHTMDHHIQEFLKNINGYCAIVFMWYDPKCKTNFREQTSHKAKGLDYQRFSNCLNFSFPHEIELISKIT